MKTTNPNQKLSQGVNVVGYFQGRFGGGEATRNFVSALKEQSIPHQLISADFLARHHTQDKLGDVFTKYGTYSVNLFCIKTSQIFYLLSRKNWKMMNRHYNIALCFWETNVVPSDLLRALKCFDEIWVASPYNQKCLSEVVTVPVRYIPHPVQLKIEASSKESFGLDQRFMFLFCFDFLSVYERKNPMAIVHAFQQAFEENQEVQLVIKSQNGHHFSTLLQSAKEEIAKDSRIQWIDESYSGNRRYELMNASDCYISLHRSEGLGLTMAEAMLMEKPVIATGYSGNLAFMNEENSFLCRYRLIPIGSGNGPYSHMGEWADVDIDHASFLMRFVFDNPKEAKWKAQKGKQDVLQNHSYLATGKAIARHLTQVPFDFMKLRTEEVRRKNYLRYVEGIVCYYMNGLICKTKSLFSKLLIRRKKS